MGAAVIGVILGWLVVAAYALQGVMPHNALELPGEHRVETRRWLPEGWAFFTRDPREPDVFVFARRGAEWPSLMRSPHGRAANAFGWNRASRAQYGDAALILTAIPAGAWRSCRGTPANCLDSTPLDPAVVESRVPRPTLCGELGLIRQQPVPWAWAAAGTQVPMPAQTVRVRVTC